MPSGFGGLQGLFSGQRILSAVPRLKSNSMLLSRFIPDSFDVASNIKATKGNGTAFVPHCLQFGAPGGIMSGGLKMPTLPSLPTGLRVGRQGGFGGFGITPTKKQSVWGLYDIAGEPQIFITITEYSATVGTVAVRFVEAEFAKAKVDPMNVVVFEGDAVRQQAASFPDGAGHAKLTWQL